ncbi:Bug family tripartite tricarboxylate transporter substrate binding protein [Roseococcus suduntuyensis]|uniref:Tripartite-type tricarboxylate transporter receptor subunit TctC n=1 Tax=Roseococcus suduntuyensis TaxID=455361 RepID=A0A840AHN2_9PROT|nr:tripartite tricarboxylate transporter substrate binding protein [Roseococcus suduntuyensis]MBB3900372.1 tripartite-type tricarboxylate transporter receptor subunit TctC [Roseococcus suduntuyensis]
MFSRRMLFASAPALAAPALLSGTASAQNFPTRPIMMVNPYPPGGATEFGARLIAQRIEQELGQSVVIDARAGAGTAIGNSFVAGQRPDGYTLLMGTTSLAVLPALQPTSVPRDPRTAFTPIGPATISPFVLHVHPDFPARTVQEVIDYAKANPGRVSWGSSGIGAINHMTLELFRARTGIDVVHVPYRGGAPALVDIAANRIQCMFAAAQEASSSIAAGRTRGIAVTSTERMASLPDLPPIAETVPGFNSVFWQGVFAPAGLSQEIAARLERAVRTAAENAEVKERLAGAGIAAWPGDAALLRDTLAQDTETWGNIIRTQNITVG